MTVSLVVWCAIIVNYGLNKVRFIAPVAAGAEIRVRVTLKELKEVGEGIYQMTSAISMEQNGETKPRMYAEWLTRFYV